MIVALLGLFLAVQSPAELKAESVAYQSDALVTLGPENSWLPTEEQRLTAIAAFTSYHDAIDAGDIGAAYEMLGPPNGLNFSFEEFSQVAQSHKPAVGELVNRQVLSVDFFRDPPGRPPGFYAIVYLTAEYSNTNRFCGFTTLRGASDNGPYIVVNNPVAFQTPDQVEGLSQQEADRRWQILSANCPHYSPDVPAVETASEAYERLRNQAGTEWFERPGLLVAVDNENNVVWAFATPDVPPPTPEDNLTPARSTVPLPFPVRCSAPARLCDQLVRDLQDQIEANRQ